MKNMRGLLTGAAVLTIVPFVATPALAQDVQRGVTVTERARPELDPLGMRVGGFLLFPSVSVEETHSDNIFKANEAEKEDFITVVTPSLALSSDWNRHALGANASAEIGRYADFDKENYEDFTLSANGRIDTVRDSNIYGSVEYAALHDDRGSPNDSAGLKPGKYITETGQLGYLHKFNRVSVDVSAQLKKYDFDDVALSSGAVTNNDDRDRDETEGRVRVGYEIVPEYEMFARLTYNDRNYDAATDDGGVNRDSSGYEAVIGTVVDFSGVTFGDFFVGYRSQDYDAASLKTVSGLAIGTSLTWNASPLTTAKGFITRTVEESTIANASGFFATTIGVSIDHELRRNVLLDGSASATRDEYKGIIREDDTIRLGLGATYMMNRNFYLSARYERDDKDASSATNDYTDNRFLVRLLVQN